jgi:rhodanese-related sulfurtransferase
MNQLLTFAIHNWVLILTLVIIIILLIFEEKKGGINLLKGTKQIDPQALINIVNHDSGLVIDLRSETEFNAGHITSAKNIPATEFASKTSSLAKYKDKPVVLVCPNGRSSQNAGTALRKQGFTNVAVLAGGINAWQRAGLPLVKS